MNKAVLISIQPKYCELIARGQKTIEVRKTRPKLETPFKAYIYCTKENFNGRYLHTSDKRGRLLFWENPNDTSITVQPENREYTAYLCCGRIIGEFICDKITPISVYYKNPKCRASLREYPLTCLRDKEIMEYLGNGVRGYGWHIADIKIYDVPKALNAFNKPCPHRLPDGTRVEDAECPCDKYTWDYDEITGKTDCTRRITKAPQSWQYVEELR